MRNCSDDRESLWHGALLPFALLLVVVALMVLPGCSSYGPAKSASNTLRAGLLEAAPLLRERCINPYEGADTMTPDEAAEALKAFDRSGCPKMLRAYETARVSHVALVAVVGAHEVGACVNSRLRECDMPRALLEASQAASAMAGLVETLRGEE